jgi:cell division protein FtsI (penicillin-binding protein 3)
MPGNRLYGGPLEPRIHDGASKRLRNLARFALFWALLIFCRLFYLQILTHDEYVRIAASQQQRVIDIPAPRGTIFDREGRPLAMSLPVKSVHLNPLLLRDVPVAVEVLSRVLNLDPEKFRKNIDNAIASNSGFLWVKRRVSAEEAERVTSLKLAGVEFREETSRKYPKGTLAAHVLGSVDHDEKGNAGIELGMQDELEGIPGALRMMTDVTRRGYASTVELTAQPGKNIVLTIDERIQYVAERRLKEAVEGCRCKSGSVVVMEPRTGDILAMTAFPTFDPNLPVLPEEDLSPRLNLAVAAPFEPGSVFKVITLAAALETTRLGPESPINCYNGLFTMFGRPIREAKGGYGVIPMRTVLAKSSNIGAIQVGLAIGIKSFHEYITKFGFGQKTNIPLPAESAGQVYPPRQWSKTSMGSVAMGHEITTTTLQLAQATSVIANNGVLVKPRIVLKKQRPGEPDEVEPVAEGIRVLRAENAARMRMMMEDVVLPGGTGTRARIPGYSVGGKTGSAQIYDFNLKQYTHKYNASFVGMAPLSNPALVVVVTLNGSSEFGGAVAAPVFQEIAAAALRILEIPKDRPETMLLARNSSPEPAPESATAALEESDKAGDSYVENAVLLAAGGPRVPNFLGKTLRNVLIESSEAGIPVDTRGQGVARIQRPAAGSILQPGDKIFVQFAQ